MEECLERPAWDISRSLWWVLQDGSCCIVDHLTIDSQQGHCWNPCKAAGGGLTILLSEVTGMADDLLEPVVFHTGFRIWFCRALVLFSGFLPWRSTHWDPCEARVPASLYINTQLSCRLRLPCYTHVHHTSPAGRTV